MLQNDESTHSPSTEEQVNPNIQECVIMQEYFALLQK